MGRRIFVAATGQHCGKTTTSICLVHLARQSGLRVAFMKPVGQQHLRVGDLDVDKDVALLAAEYGLEADLPYMSPVVVKSDVTRRAIDGEFPRRELAERMVRAADELARRSDLLVIEGTGHGGVGSVLGLNNAQVARLLGAPVVLVAEGGIGKLVDAVMLNVALYRMEEVEVRAVVVNKLLPEKRESTLDYVGRALGSRGLTAVRGLDWSSVLAHPTLGAVSRMLDVPLRGNPAGARRIAHHIQLGAASTQRVVDLLKESTLLVTNCSRDELIVTTSALYNIESYHPLLAGLVVTGHAAVSPVAERILVDSGMPFMRVERLSGEVFVALTEYISKIGPEDREKLALLHSRAETLAPEVGRLLGV